jgi:hypothetical protein
MSGDDPTPQQSVLRLRFPDGDVELRWTTDKLPVGVLVRSRGTLWRVRRHDRGTVVLEPASAADQAKHGPVVKPTPLGDDESILLETINEV